MVDNVVVSPSRNAFEGVREGVLKDSVHRRIRRLAADIKNNMKIKDANNLPNNPPLSRVLTPTSFRVGRPFTPVEKNSAKIFIEKIRAYKERRRKVGNFFLLPEFT